MANFKEGTALEEEVALVVKRLQEDPSFWRLKEVVREEIVKRDDEADLRRLVPVFLEASGLDVGLKNAAWQHTRRGGRQHDARHAAALGPAHEEPFDYVRAAQARWKAKVFKRVNVLAKESGLPLSRRRPAALEAAPRDELLEKLTFKPLAIGVFLYDVQDLQQELRLLFNPNFAAEGIGLHHAPPTDKVWLNRASAAQPWGLIQANLHVKSLSDLRRELRTLGVGFPQQGVDSSVHVKDRSYAEMREKQGAQVHLGGYRHECALFSRSGCTLSTRPDVWFTLLCAEHSDGYRIYYDQVMKEVHRYDFLIDRLVLADCAMLSGRDDNYFVFEDVLKEVLLAFLRDTAVLQMYPNPRPIVATAKLQVSGTEVAYPPSGVLPFKGLGYLVAPICYLYSEPARVFTVFRELYTRYFYRLHTLSSHEQGLIRLSALFESLLQNNQPRLFLHLKDVGADPLSIALPWLVQAFAGFLSVSEVLLLWDRIVGFDSLNVLPVLASAIFAFRGRALLLAKTAAEVESVMQDLTGIMALPLLQHALFGGE